MFELHRHLVPVVATGALAMVTVGSGLSNAPRTVAQPNNPSQCEQAGPGGSVTRCSRGSHDGIYATPPQVSPAFEGIPFGGS
ncbi:MAG: hypothetical protein SW019_16000 [Actinomycetota bacterium]|nr:hypothetical protein [Actinomycetota bacterium]